MTEREFEAGFRRLLEEIVSGRYGKASQAAMLLHDAAHAESGACDALDCTCGERRKPGCLRHAAYRRLDERLKRRRKALLQVFWEQLQRFAGHVAGDGADREADPFCCGYAAALATLQRLHDRPALVASVLEGDDLDLEGLAAAGADEGDLAVLRAPAGRRERTRRKRGGA